MSVLSRISDNDCHTVATSIALPYKDFVNYLEQNTLRKVFICNDTPSSDEFINIRRGRIEVLKTWVINEIAIRVVSLLGEDQIKESARDLKGTGKILDLGVKNDLMRWLELYQVEIAHSLVNFSNKTEEDYLGQLMCLRATKIAPS